MSMISRIADNLVARVVPGVEASALPSGPCSAPPGYCEAVSGYECCCVAQPSPIVFGWVCVKKS